jgi:hypothetical protein
MIGATVSLFAVDLDRVLAVWRKASIAEHLADSPAGRAATVLGLASLAGADPSLTPARAAAGAPAADARNLFEALVEDLAVARLHDAPFMPLSHALASLARAGRLPRLEMSALQASPPAYPADVRAPDGAGLCAWLPPDAVAQAAAAASADPGDPPRSGDAALWRDLVEALGDLFENAAGLTVVARVV